MSLLTDLASGFGYGIEAQRAADRQRQAAIQYAQRNQVRGVCDYYSIPGPPIAGLGQHLAAPKTPCKSCGAPHEPRKCSYCGTEH